VVLVAGRSSGEPFRVMWADAMALALAGTGAGSVMGGLATRLTAVLGRVFAPDCLVREGGTGLSAWGWAWAWGWV
jgi:hypothetical protein